MNPLIPLILDESRARVASPLTFANGCPGSCGHTDPSQVSPGDRDYIITPEPVVFEAGTIG